MRLISLFFLLSTILIACSKDNSEITSYIKLNYTIGDHLKYEFNMETHLDDTTVANKDTTTYFKDTFEVFILKDTIINSKKCLVKLQKSSNQSDSKVYLEITDSSYNAYAYLFNQRNEVILYEKPGVEHKRLLQIGTFWESNNGIPNNLVVKDLSSISIYNRIYFCAKIEYKLPYTSSINSIINYTEYVDEKGMVFWKTDIEGKFLSIGDPRAGYIYSKRSASRIE